MTMPVGKQNRQRLFTPLEARLLVALLALAVTAVIMLVRQRL